MAKESMMLGHLQVSHEMLRLIAEIDEFKEDGARESQINYERLIAEIDEFKGRWEAMKSTNGRKSSSV